MIPALNQPNLLWLETLDLTAVKQDYGKPGKARTVDGATLTLNHKGYQHGLGTHAESELVIDLHRSASSFTADVGVDDESGARGSVRFLIRVDGKKRLYTKVMRGGQAPQHVEVDLRGADRLELNVEDAGDGIDYDHADWADGAITWNPGQRQPNAMHRPLEKTLKIYQNAPEKPEINGPRVVGCSPGKPFLFRVPVSGIRPFKFSVDTLPPGLGFETTSGVFSGVISQPGSYHLDVSVAGPKGKDKRTLEIRCGERKLAQTPPMGWNSWNVWGTSVTADKVRAAAEALVAHGLADYGYRYVNIDDAWEGSRDSSGAIQANEKFGSMRELAVDVHSRGLMLGIYSSPGPKTCGGYEGSYGHEQQDANTYATWGIDYLKYDWCSYGEIAPKEPSLADLQAPYNTMREALDRCGRDIVFSLCQYGMGDVYKWGKAVGGNLWRTTGDITDSWGSMSSIAFQHTEKAFGAGPGGWNDPDMLVVGNLGWGENPRSTRLTRNEQITHITMWALLAAPLLLGCDLSTLDPWTKALITNHEVIEVDQDPLGKAAIRVKANDSGAEVWARPLWDGTMAVGLINRAREEQTLSVSWWELGLQGPLPLRDLWERKSLGAREQISVRVPSHGAKLFRIGKVKS
jgi:alpha-galactosidase